MSSVFTRIVRGEISCYKIAETENFLAFLDVFPLVKGHTLVIPKTETDNIFDMDPELFQGLFGFAQKIGKAIEKSIPCKKVGIAVVGLEVPHAHIHLVPLNETGDINFLRPKLVFSESEMNDIKDLIIKGLK